MATARVDSSASRSAAFTKGIEQGDGMTTHAEGVDQCVCVGVTRRLTKS